MKGIQGLDETSFYLPIGPKSSPSGNLEVYSTLPQIGMVLLEEDRFA